MMSHQEQAERQHILSDAAVMRDWRGTAAHDVWVRHQDALIQQAVERILACDQQQFPHLKGLVEGLRTARSLPQHIEFTARRVAQYPHVVKNT
jgi:hypothetical protein